MGYDTIEVTPLAGSLGAEVGRVDLTRVADNRTWDEIARAFAENVVLVFRDQQFTPDDLMAVGGRFGEPSFYPFVQGLPDHPYIFEIVKEPTDKINFGGNWHSDTTYLERPPLATLLYARETPTHGGDTLFANMYAAYDSLSDGMKETLGRLRGVNNAALKHYAGGRASYHANIAKMTITQAQNADEVQAIHPVVRTHPVTGRKALYLNRSHTIRFDGWTEAESKPLIDFLAAHATRPEFTCRVRWRPGTLTVWDNRCAQHLAINDYHGQRRVMQRLTVGPQAPA
ncbi:MAG: TauD/TfdA dioxygenase family protein [Alphaproteobacteria bacterium]